MSGVFRAKPVDPGKLDAAERIFSELLCDPERINDIRYHVLDELDQRAAFLRGMDDDQQRNYWRDEEGRSVPSDYRHYKSKPLAPEDDTKLTTDMFELD